jgi:hypothetical protein
LNENQAHYVMTLSRNTEQVAEAKYRLIKAFSDAKQLIAYYQQVESQQALQHQLDTQHLMLHQHTRTQQKQTAEAIKQYLLEAGDYCRTSGNPYATFNDALNLYVIGERAGDFKRRTGLKVESIRDYFPDDVLLIYFSALQFCQYLMQRGMSPFDSLSAAFDQMNTLHGWQARKLEGRELESIKAAARRQQEWEKGQRRLMGY